MTKFSYRLFCYYLPAVDMTARYQVLYIKSIVNILQFVYLGPTSVFLGVLGDLQSA